MIEPGRFRLPRSDLEKVLLTPVQLQAELCPGDVPARLFVTHTRPEVLLGILLPLNTESHHTGALGFINPGETLDVLGMLFVNRSTWAHILLEVTRVLDMLQGELLTSEELAALSGKASPEGMPRKFPG